MKASKNDIVNLKKIQKLDADIKSQMTRLDELPERKQFYEVSLKLQELNGKARDVEAMKRDVEKRFEKMSSEDASLNDREKQVQHEIDEVAGDYKNLEVHTKELDAILSRRNTLSEIMFKATVEQDKVEELEKKLKTAIEQLSAKANCLSNKVKIAKMESAVTVNQLTSSRNKIYANLPTDISKLYDEAVCKVGNVVLATLDGCSCSVCRSPIEEGKLYEIQKSEEISVCPVCGRIIINN